MSDTPKTDDTLQLDDAAVPSPSVPQDSQAPGQPTSESQTSADAATEPQPAQQTATEPQPAADESTKSPTPDPALPLAILTEKKSFPLMAWLKISHPTYFVAALAPLFLGFFSAIRYDGIYRPWFFALIIVACFLVHLATNIANDLFRAPKSAKPTETAEPSGQSPIPPRQLKTALFFCYAIALVLAIFIVKTDKILWIIVIFSALSSFFYFSPPIKYGRRGLAELFVFLNMGLIMTVGTHMALTKFFDPKVVALAFPTALMAAGIMFFQSLTSIESDRATGHKTLALRLGREKASFLHFIIWPAIWLFLINLWLAGLAAWPVLLAPVTFLIHWLVCHRLRKNEDWSKIESSGYLIRLMSLINGILLIVGVALLPDTVATPRPVTSPPKPAPIAAPAEPTPTPPAAPSQPAQVTQTPPPAAPAPTPSAAASEPAPPAAPSQPAPVTQTPPPAEPALTPPAAASEPAPPAAPSQPAPVTQTPPAEPAPTPPAATAEPAPEAVATPPVSPLPEAAPLPQAGPPEPTSMSPQTPAQDPSSAPTNPPGLESSQEEPPLEIETSFSNPWPPHFGRGDSSELDFVWL
ncbi:MAG: UbiA family prenyltransferase [Deltaproteobacteria bacterium]|jgi:1,4-dihydroxy-2-naphthoate octaprenyltransferase|nr:UbiA family prenyltransferase [Deltaproteobacteria bacterium]